MKTWHRPRQMRWRRRWATFKRTKMHAHGATNSAASCSIRFCSSACDMPRIRAMGCSGRRKRYFMEKIDEMWKWSSFLNFLIYASSELVLFFKIFTLFTGTVAKSRQPRASGRSFGRRFSSWRRQLLVNLPGHVPHLCAAHSSGRHVARAIRESDLWGETRGKRRVVLGRRLRGDKGTLSPLSPFDLNPTPKKSILRVLEMWIEKHPEDWQQPPKFLLVQKTLTFCTTYRVSLTCSIIQLYTKIKTFFNLTNQSAEF